MSGYENFNYDAFRHATKVLRDKGWTVYSPAEIDEKRGIIPNQPETHATYEENMEVDLHIITHPETDAIVLLEGWELSPGTQMELQTAIWTGREVYLFDEELPTSLMTVTGTAQDKLDDARVALQHKLLGEPVMTPSTGEVRMTSETGGQKGQKLARFDLIPAGPLNRLAEHYGYGAFKYEDRNWERGYNWSLNFAALNRHLWAWWRGEDVDPDSEHGTLHLTAVAWHAFALLEFMETKPEFDDRPSTLKRKEKELEPCNE